MSIYVMQPADGGIIKLGYSHDVPVRQIGLSKYFPYGVELVCQFDGDRTDELFLHHCFKPVRIKDARGEWYRSALPIWRMVAEAVDHGRPSWIPTSRIRDGRDIAIKEFGGKAEALAACGYAPATSFDGAFSNFSSRGASTAKLMFTLALRAGNLPEYIAALHGQPQEAHL